MFTLASDVNFRDWSNMDIIGVTRYFNEFFYRLLFVNASKMIGRLMLKACHIILEVDYLLETFTGTYIFLKL